MRLSALALLVLTAAACAPEPSDTGPGAPSEAPVRADTVFEEAPGEAPGVESFADFFARFRADTAFQRTRLAEPVRYRTLVEDDAMEMVEQESDLDHWAAQPLVWDGVERVVERFNGQSAPGNVDPDADRVDYAIEGLDNGVNVTYSFERRGAQWMLVRLSDLSM
jgi:hypothetical protein